MRMFIAIAALIASSPAVSAGPDARRVFSDAWRGKRVAVTRTLYTLVYNERGKFGKVFHDRREGLLVATPSAGTYFRFDGRDSEEDIVARDPQQVVDRIGEAYRRASTLDIGFYLRVEPLLVVRYEAGGALVVTDVEIERDRVRMSFGSVAGDAPADELATALTIQWPAPLSAALTERPLIEGLIRQFVDDKGDRRSTAGVRD